MAFIVVVFFFIIFIQLNNFKLYSQHHSLMVFLPVLTRTYQWVAGATRTSRNVWLCSMHANVSSTQTKQLLLTLSSTHEDIQELQRQLMLLRVCQQRGTGHAHRQHGSLALWSICQQLEEGEAAWVTYDPHAVTWGRETDKHKEFLRTLILLVVAWLRRVQILLKHSNLSRSVFKLKPWMKKTFRVFCLLNCSVQ